MLMRTASPEIKKTDEPILEQIEEYLAEVDPLFVQITKHKYVEGLILTAFNEVKKGKEIKDAVDFEYEFLNRRGTMRIDKSRYVR